MREYIDELAKAADRNKDSRIRLKKIYEYISILEARGARAGEPFVKHIDGKLWELRPSSDRIFFFYGDDQCFVLLHHFMKKSRKTPQKEIDTAERNMLDYIHRSK